MAILNESYLRKPRIINTNPTGDTDTVRTVFFQCVMSDVEDPLLYAAEPIYDWQQTEKGKWCTEHSIGEMTLHTQINYLTLGFDVVVIGNLSEQDHTLFKLKWG